MCKYTCVLGKLYTDITGFDATGQIDYECSIGYVGLATLLTYVLRSNVSCHYRQPAHLPHSGSHARNETQAAEFSISHATATPRTPINIAMVYYCLFS